MAYRGWRIAISQFSALACHFSRAALLQSLALLHRRYQRDAAAGVVSTISIQRDNELPNTDASTLPDVTNWGITRQQMVALTHNFAMLQPYLQGIKMTDEQMATVMLFVASGESNPYESTDLCTPLWMRVVSGDARFRALISDLTAPDSPVRSLPLRTTEQTSTGPWTGLMTQFVELDLRLKRVLDAGGILDVLRRLNDMDAKTTEGVVSVLTEQHGGDAAAAALTIALAQLGPRDAQTGEDSPPQQQQQQQQHLHQQQQPQQQQQQQAGGSGKQKRRSKKKGGRS